jgi:SAM-dependent methyltransferase
MNKIHNWYCRSAAWKRRVDTELMPWALAGVTLSGPGLEIGPGPGITTDYIRTKVDSLTALEADPILAERLRRRFQNTSVNVVKGDATAIPFENGAFRTVFCFTMLHHVPSFALQNKLFAEVRRVLAPGGVFVGTDSRLSLRMKVFHWFDTMVIVDPLVFPKRLLEAGFTDPQIELGQGAFRFRAAREL